MLLVTWSQVRLRVLSERIANALALLQTAIQQSRAASECNQCQAADHCLTDNNGVTRMNTRALRQSPPPLWQTGLAE